MADFQEVAETFRKLIEDIRQDPAQLLERGTEERFKEIAMHSVSRTKAQQEFAKSQEEHFFVSKRQGLLERQLTLDAKLQTDLSEAASASAQAELEVLQQLLDQNDRILDSINEQVQEYGIAVGKVIELNEFERRRAEIAAEMEAIKITMVGLSGKELALQLELLDALEGEDKVRRDQVTGSHQIHAAQTLRNKQEEVFGFSVQGANDKIKEMGGLMNTTTGRITLAAMAMKILLGPVVKHMKELRDLGLTWTQTMEAGMASLAAASDIGGLRGLLTFGETLEATVALRSNFADIRFQTHEIIAVATEMGVSFKLSGAEAANLVEILAKVGGLSADAQIDILHMATAFGTVNKLRPDILIKAMAQHAGVFARFGEEGAQAFMRSVGAAERLGIELSSIESAADSFLDIDTFFQDVSKLRTLGLDISDPFGLAQIAETGTPAELIAELQRQLQGVDLTQLSRTRRNALSSALGMDQAELSRLIQGDIGGIDEVSQAQIDELGGFNEGMGGAVDALSAMVGTLGGISGVLGHLVDLLILRSFLSGAGSLLGLGSLAGGASAVAGGIGTAATVVAGTAGAVGTAALGTAAGIAGSPVLLALLAGAATLAVGGIVNEKRKIRRDDASGAASEVRGARAQARMAEAGVISPAMMDQLSTAVRSGVEGAELTAFFDAKRVTSALQKSQGRANN